MFICVHLWLIFDAYQTWTLPAAEFLAQGDVGVTPWVPLMEFTGLPETLLERCTEKIEREAHPKDRADLLVVSQVMAGLRFPDPVLLQILGGQRTMIESPLIQKVIAESIHQDILALLKDRFDTVPRNLTKPLREILDEKKLRQLILLAVKCPDLQTFREALLS